MYNCEVIGSDLRPKSIYSWLTIALLWPFRSVFILSESPCVGWTRRFPCIWLVWDSVGFNAAGEFPAVECVSAARQMFSQNASGQPCRYFFCLFNLNGSSDGHPGRLPGFVAHNELRYLTRVCGCVAVTFWRINMYRLSNFSPTNQLTQIVPWQ
jgi:hypothetical protein